MPCILVAPTISGYAHHQKVEAEEGDNQHTAQLVLGLWQLIISIAVGSARNWRL
jgi:hypothetical protein